MTATIHPFPAPLVRKVPCAMPGCGRIVTLRTPSKEAVEAFCCPGHARQARPEWFKVSLGGDSHG